MAIYQLAPVLGPVLAPMAGGFIAQYATWEWTFWSISIFCGCLQILAIFLLRETYAPHPLATKAERLSKVSGQHHVASGTREETVSEVWRTALIRPWRLIGTQPIIQGLSLYQAFNYGMLYLVISSFPPLWEERYGYSKSIASLNYLALLGSLPSSQITGWATDKIYAYFRAKQGLEKGQCPPEFRIPLMVPAAAISSFGILLFG